MSKPSGRGRHSFVQFYMSDWLAGTARMPRPARSVYLDVCCYTWDKVQPVPKGVLALMLMDLEGMGLRIIDSLVDTGQLVRNEDGSVYSPRAMAEAERALAAWEAKSRGGRAKTVERELEESSKTLPAEPEPEPEPELDEKDETASPPKIVVGWNMIPPAWNAMAAKHGLTQVLKMTDERTKRLKVRIEVHGVNAILEAIEAIPEAPFLMGGGERGWKANFDWLVRPEGCAQAVERHWQNQGRKKSWNGENDGNGTGKSGNAYVNAALEREAERAAGKS